MRAAALTWAICAAVNTGGRPQRFAPPSEAAPGAAHQRRRHLRTVSAQTRSDAAITAFGVPSAAASTILARVTRRCSVRPARTRRRSPRRCGPVNVIRSAGGLMRLRYGGSASRWGFAIYLASKNGYQDSVLPTGHTAGSPEDALDTACGLYLGDPTAWTRPRRTYGREP